MKIEINADYVRALMKCQAVDDPRDYLNGFLITGNKLYSSNGHIALAIDYECEIEEPIVLDIQGEVPEDSSNMTIEFLDSRYAIIEVDTYTDYEVSTKYLLGISRDASSYPDMDKIKPKEEIEVESLKLQTHYLSKPLEVFDSEASVEVKTMKVLDSNALVATNTRWNHANTLTVLPLSQ